MTFEQLREKVCEWDLQQDEGADSKADSKYTFLLDQLDFHAKRDWRVYLPAEHPEFNPEYQERLSVWIGNLDDENAQKLLLEYATYISFFSHKDFLALYRTAMGQHVTPWVAAQAGIKFNSPDGRSISEVMWDQIHKKTWFCPVTDSMDINEFYKVNHLTGIAHRPAFSTLRMLELKNNPIAPFLPKALLKYMSNPSSYPDQKEPPLERLVLIEDIVGSGSQCLPTIKWVMKNLDIPVLFIPLVLCPNGAENLRKEEVKNDGRLTVSPVIELQRKDLLGPERQKQPGWPISDKLESLTEQYSDRFPKDQLFGFNDTGCSLVTFSNTPNNTLPLVHQHNHQWKSLFPRVLRD